jgi:hypothetical protein
MSRLLAWLRDMVVVVVQIQVIAVFLFGPPMLLYYVLK